MRRYRNEILVCLALVVLTLGALGHVCANGFVNYDDNDYVVQNREVKAGLSAAGLAWAFRTTRAANWHPLTWLSLQLDAQLYGGEAAWGFHLTNLLLHTANTVLLFLALRRMTGAVWRSAAVAALFAVHPAHVESVAWVAERKDVLSGLFWMLTLLAYASYAERPSWRRYLPVMAAFALGLLAKPMLVTLPCVLLLLDYWPLDRLKSQITNKKSQGNSNTQIENPKPGAFGSLGFRFWDFLGISNLRFLILEKLPLFALTAAACLVTVYAQQKGGAVNTLEQVPLNERVMNSMSAYAGYLGELVWPAGLAPFYPHPHGRLLLEQTVRAGLVLASISGLVLWTRRRYLAVGWLWFLGTLVPVIGLVQVGSQAMADRYTYLPYVGLFIAVVWGAADLAARRSVAVRGALAPAALLLGLWAPLALWLALGAGSEMLADRRLVFLPLAGLSLAAVVLWAVGRAAGFWPARLSPLVPVAALLLGTCAALSTWQARLWQNSIWLWEWTVQVTTDNGIGHNNLGTAYWNSRHYARRERARDNFLATLRLIPRHAKAHNNLGLIDMDEGRLDEAEARFAEARRLEPTLLPAAQNLGSVLARRGRFEEAIAQFEEALLLDPTAASTHDRLGLAQAGAGRWEEAAAAFAAAVRLEPQDIVFRANLGWSLWHLGREDEARQEYAAVVARDADWPEAVRASAWVWATDADAGRRNRFEAVRRAEQAWLARGTCDPMFLDTLAAAYAENQDFERAVQQAEKALAVAGDDAALAAKVKERLEGYRHRTPYRQRS